jgi:hypothetical protein
MSSEQPIDAYLEQTAAALPGPRAARHDIVAELRSGLLDAIDAHRAAGLAPTAAARAAIHEFGHPRDVAAWFRPELVARQARRVALTLAATGLPVGVLWAFAAHASDAGSRDLSFWRWATAPPVPLAVAGFLIAMAAVLANVAITGRLIRWLPVRPRAAAIIAAAGGVGVAAVDLAILVLLVSRLLSAPSSLAAGPVSAAAIASITRLCVARGATRRCLAARLARSEASATPGLRV